MIIGSFTKLLQAVCDTFADRTKYMREATETLKALLQGDCNVDSISWEEAGNEFSKLPLDVLLPKYQEVVSIMITTCKRFAEELQSIPQTSSSQVAFRNGEMFLIVGLLQAFLLSPQGPVDPAEKQNILLTYSEQEVCTVSGVFPLRTLTPVSHAYINRNWVREAGD